MVGAFTLKELKMARRTMLAFVMTFAKTITEIIILQSTRIICIIVVKKIIAILPLAPPVL